MPIAVKESRYQLRKKLLLVQARCREVRAFSAEYVPLTTVFATICSRSAQWCLNEHCSRERSCSYSLTEVLNKVLAVETQYDDGYGTSLL